MSRLSGLLEPVPELTNIVKGYSSPELLAEQIFPVITVEKEVGKIRSYGKEFFLQYETLRALRADSNRVPPGSSTLIDYELQEYDIEIPIDYRELDANPKLKAREANRTAQLLKNRFEKMLADTLQNTASYASGHSTTIGTANDQWNDVDSDPLGQIDTARALINTKIGMDPNTMLLSYDTFLALRKHAQFVDKIKYSQKAVVTVDLLKEFLEIENIFVSKALYTDSASGTLSRMYTECAALMYISPATTASEENPSFGYTLRKKNSPQSGEYTTPNGKITAVGTTYIQDQIITCDTAGYLFLNTLT